VSTGRLASRPPRRGPVRQLLPIFNPPENDDGRHRSSLHAHPAVHLRKPKETVIPDVGYRALADIAWAASG